MQTEVIQAYRNLSAGIALQAIDDAVKVKPIGLHSESARARVKDDARDWLDNHGYGVLEWLDLDPAAIDDSLYRLLDCS